MLNYWVLKVKRIVERLRVEERLKITKSEPNTFGDSLSSIPRIEDSISCSFWQKVHDSMRKILHFVYHNIMNLRPIISSEPNDIKDIVHSIHDIVSSVSDFPSFVLTESFIDIQLLFFGQEDISSKIHISVLTQVLSRELMSLCWTLDSGVNFSPNQMWSDIARAVVFSDN